MNKIKQSIFSLNILLILIVSSIPVIYYGGSWYLKYDSDSVIREIEREGGVVRAPYTIWDRVYLGGTSANAEVALKILVKYHYPKKLDCTHSDAINELAKQEDRPYLRTIDDELMKYIGQMHWLLELDLNGNTITDEGFQKLSGLHNLRKLRIADTQVTDSGITALAELRNLKELTLNNTAVTSSGLKQIVKNNVGLQNDEMEGIIESRKKNVHIPLDDQLAAPVLKSLMNLQQPTDQLSISDPGFTDQSFKLVGQMEWLNTLKINCANITDVGLESIGEIKNLQSLFINSGAIESNIDGNISYSNMNLNFTEKGLRHLSHLKHLESLTLVNVKVTDEGIKAISNVTTLKRLSLGVNVFNDETVNHLTSLINLEELHLGGSELSDIGLISIGKIKSLKKLMLSGNKITKDGIKHLSDLQSLEELYINSSNVSASDIKQLMKKIPSLNNKKMESRLKQMRDKESR